MKDQFQMFVHCLERSLVTLLTSSASALEPIEKTQIAKTHNTTEILVILAIIRPPIDKLKSD